MIQDQRLRDMLDTDARTYTIRLRCDLRPRRLRRWTATVDHGIAHLENGVWRGRDRAKLIARIERWATRDRLRDGDPRPPIIRVREPE